MKKPKKIEVVQPEKEIPAKVMADAIVQIAEGFKRVKASGLNNRALLVLLKDSSGVSMAAIQKVLNALDQLKQTYLQ